MTVFTYQTIRSVLVDQVRRFKSSPPGVKRRFDLDKYWKHPNIIVITGVRRSGKSTLLRQISEEFPDYLYINLDDERLAGCSIHELTEVVKIYEELLPGSRTIFVDEVQNVLEWERFIRRIHDDGYHVFLTGSNANLLSAELGTRLTGRYVKIELWPFGFDEFCRSHSFERYPVGTSEEAEVNRLFAQYLEGGGFPGYLNYQDTELLQQIYEDIIYRDIIGRYQVREVLPLRELARYLFSNITHEASYQSLSRISRDVSPISIKNWIGYLEDSYLISGCYQFDYSLRRQHLRSRKYYCVDTGMRNSVGFRFSDDTGLLLENVVWLELVRQGEEVYWFRGKGECDFIIFDKGEVTAAVQVCTELTDQNLAREVSGLIEAMKLCRCDIGYILTMRQFDQIEISDKKISVIPVWHFILDSVGFRPVL